MEMETEDKLQVETLKVGDTFKLAGLYKKIPNPDREWWQPWKPRHIVTNELVTMTVISVFPHVKAWGGTEGATDAES